MLNDLYTQINIEKPISTNKIGENLSATVYDQIKKARPKDLCNQEGWSEVINLTIKNLQLTKDINICAWLLEGLSYKYNIQGFLTGIKIINDLLESFPNCYPLEEEKKRNNLMWIKENSISWLINKDIFPGINFSKIYKDIYNSRIDNNILEKLTSIPRFELGKYIKNAKKELENNTKELDNISNTLLTDIVSHYKGFLNQIIKIYDSTITKLDNYDKEILAKKNAEIKKKTIYDQIDDLLKTAMIENPQDILLPLMKKILILRKKNDLTLVLKIITENKIDTLIKIE